MTKAYLVARGIRVTFAFMMGSGMPRSKDTTWMAPVLDKDAKLYLSRSSAVEYCNRMNGALHNPNKNTINIAPYDDYMIFPMEKA